jgi:TPR repeat protein
MGGRQWKTPALNEINLGDITDQEQGESRDDAMAAKFFLRQAERGDARAQINIALMLADGTGVARDPLAAYLWAELAAYRATGKLRANAVKLQAHLEQSLSDVNIEKAKEAARLWHPKTG